MALTRGLEEHEIAPELRRVYVNIRYSLDLPFVPEIFKLLAGMPEYLRAMWASMEPLVSSQEFHAATDAFQEIAHSTAVTGGWKFSDQPKILAAEKFSNADIRVFGGMVGLFARSTAQMALLSRLMQRGYSGGQRGRVSSSNQVSALAQMVKVHVPSEREAGLRVWLIYSDIRRVMGTTFVPDLFRVFAPFPPYLAAAWIDSKRLLAEPQFISGREELNRRVRSLLTGLPVKDHHHLAPDLKPEQWREIEEIVDGAARILPQLVLLSSIWQRSFPTASRLIGAA